MNRIAKTATCWLMAAAGATAQAVPARPEFEVASIKHNTSGSGLVRVGGTPGGRWSAENVWVRVLIRTAYDVKDSQITGGPSWIDSDRFDITAKAENNAGRDQTPLMLQSLLADRFKLVLDRETKEAPVYEVTAAKGGLELPAAKAWNCVTFDPKNPLQSIRPGEVSPKYCGNVRVGRGRMIDASGITMPPFLSVLSDMLGRTVVDKTGFTGTFDAHLEFTPDDATPGLMPPPGLRPVALPPADSAGLSIFTALQEQLGLKLESAKGRVEMLVIDHIEKPSEN